MKERQWRLGRIVLRYINGLEGSTSQRHRYVQTLTFHASFPPVTTMGVGAVATVNVYDTADESWSTAALTNPLAQLATAATASKVIFAGGSTVGGVVLTSADVYDIATGTWSYEPNALTAGRVPLAGVSTPTKTFFAGGNGAASYATVDIYDDATATWSNTSLPGGARSLIVGVAVGNVVLD